MATTWFYTYTSQACQAQSPTDKLAMQSIDVSAALLAHNSRHRTKPGTFEEAVSQCYKAFSEEHGVCFTLLVTEQPLLGFAAQALRQAVPVHELMQDVEVCLAQEPDLGFHPVIHKHLQDLPHSRKHERNVDQKHPTHQLLHTSAISRYASMQSKDSC